MYDDRVGVGMIESDDWLLREVGLDFTLDLALDAALDVTRDLTLDLDRMRSFSRSFSLSASSLSSSSSSSSYSRRPRDFGVTGLFRSRSEGIERESESSDGLDG
ncbi:hypothetical protein RRF57_005858 [Xylaria bambusicola]|uniref:Uncharacterized protein n=1 Tax=Xylaria bambusicola TaxID=326684 RepID=A0AAN7Z8B8_9PEZI